MSNNPIIVWFNTPKLMRTTWMEWAAIGQVCLYLLPIIILGIGINLLFFTKFTKKKVPYGTLSLGGMLITFGLVVGYFVYIW